MSGPSVKVHLYRDSFNTPWGFRLQGGKDLNQSLSVQRVFSNSPAEGELQRGDYIIQIGDKLSKDLTHKQAQDLIKFAGGQINLVIQRPPTGPASHQPIRQHQVQAPQFRQAAPSQMPQQPGSNYGFQPKKVTLSRLGGGGPEFGSDYGRSAPQVYSAPRQQAYRPPQQSHQMLNRVQESLDNIILSPRTPEPYQSPGGSYYQPSSQPSFSPPGQPSYSPQQISQISFTPSQPSYTPTGVRIDQGLVEEDQEDFLPVWERRKTFQQGPKLAVKPVKPSKPVKFQKPEPIGRQPLFGIDYAQQAPKTTQVTWTPRPAPQAPPAPAPAPPPFQQFEPDVGRPAWRETLRSTGVKPWDADMDYTMAGGAAPPPTQPKPSPQQRSVPSQSAPMYSSPSAPSGAPSGGGQDDGPRVVHLQYNSPMGLYSSKNIRETFEGQTRAAAGKPSGPAQQPGKPGERDWGQSAVYRLIKEEETRKTTTTVSNPGQPPKTYSTSMVSQQQQSFYPSRPPADDEIGISDF